MRIDMPHRLKRGVCDTASLPAVDRWNLRAVSNGRATIDDHVLLTDSTIDIVDGGMHVTTSTVNHGSVLDSTLNVASAIVCAADVRPGVTPVTGLRTVGRLALKGDPLVSSPTTGMGRAVVASVIALAMTLILSACDHTPASSSTSEATVSAVASSTYRVGSPGGYATFQMISENRRFLDHALAELARRCMAAAGFQYWPALDRPKEYSDPARPLTVKGAEARGYHSLDPPPDHGRNAEIDAYFQTLTNEQQQEYERTAVGAGNDVYQFQTFLGTGAYPKHGCAGNAVTQITDKPAEFVRLELIMMNLTDAPEYRPDDDAGLQAPLARWHSCMTKTGYDFKTPRAAEVAGGQLDAAAARKAGLELEPDDPSPEAWTLAIADATCRASSRWNDAYARAVHNALAVVIDAHQADVLAWEDISAAAVKNAKAVLSK